MIWLTLYLVRRLRRKLEKALVFAGAGPELACDLASETETDIIIESIQSGLSIQDIADEKIEEWAI